MKGYVAQRRGRYYVVIYEGRDPVTGKERRTWHPAGTDRTEAERLATKLAAVETKRVGAVRSLTFGAYLTSQWLPAKKLYLATSTYRGYERNVQLHILPALGRTSIRRLRYQQIESLSVTSPHPHPETPTERPPSGRNHRASGKRHHDSPRPRPPKPIAQHSPRAGNSGMWNRNGVDGAAISWARRSSGLRFTERTRPGARVARWCLPVPFGERHPDCSRFCAALRSSARRRCSSRCCSASCSQRASSAARPAT